MRKFISVTASIIALSFCVNADLINLTAKGNIYSSNVSTVPIGTAVEYSFQFDTDLEAYCLLYNDTKSLYHDNTYVDYFYTDFQGGYVLPHSDVMTTSVKEFNQGFSYTNAYMSNLQGGTGSHIVQLYTYGCKIEDWQLGTTLYGLEYSYFNSVYPTVYSKLTITSITGQNVPEPTAIFMILSGFSLLGIGRLRTLAKRR